MKFRDNGAVGAILDEYEKAIQELQQTIKDVNTTKLTEIVDSKTTDEDCRSIQTILAHVISSGFNYVIEMRNYLGESVTYTKPKLLESSLQYTEALDKMFAYNEQLFKDYPNLNLYEFNPEKKILVRWKQRYDVDQLFEHAIVHVLRHRRQIERFKITLSCSSNNIV